MITHLKSLGIRALLAVALAASTGTVFAGPTYHVSVDTTGLSGQGYLDLSFLALDGAAPASAVLSHFDGAYGTTAITTGSVSGDTAFTVNFGNDDAVNELLQAVGFGGLLGFDVRFDIAGQGGIGTSFGIALVNAALDDYVPGTGGNVGVIGLMPGLPITVSADGRFVTVNPVPVPEPADAPLFAGGLLLLSLTVRRRLTR